MQNVITTVVNYAREKGRSLMDLATKAKPSVIASATGADTKEVEAVIKAAAKVAEKNPGRASNCLKELSDSVLATLAGAIEKNLNGGAKAPAATTATTFRPTERATVTNLLALNDDRLKIETMRIGMRLLRQDGGKSDKEMSWPTAHLAKNDGGQGWRFEKVIDTVTSNIREEGHEAMTPTDMEKKLSGAFTGLQRKIYREAKQEIAGEDFEAYIKSIGFSVGKTTDPDKGTISKGDAEEAIALMQRKSLLDPADALSVVTDMDWPAAPANGTPVQPPVEDDGFSNEPAAPADDGFES